jgi:hypothetical protein
LCDGVYYGTIQPWKGKVWDSAGAAQQVRVGGLIGASWIAGCFRLRLEVDSDHNGLIFYTLYILVEYIIPVHPSPNRESLR